MSEKKTVGEIARLAAIVLEQQDRISTLEKVAKLIVLERQYPCHSWHEMDDLLIELGYLGEEV